ncbi:acetolactate synthase small subunit [Paenibacillus sp. LMG 31456]|uniref:Acetolactate synthase small subunit n=1 Tax=Paenibacillus foliorum TaxID=2654974 RepID=A0A972H2D5_9BACL|nr:acetolactate synthase small subunit [Paenibacillus foliorum]NOU98177.1 acetolactate synthase small subunit [Paenibacillus foliorum]
MMNKHIISILVNDQPGVLQRVSGLFGRRGFNIDSITVGSSVETGLSRMIIVTTGDERTIEQVEKQLNKLIDVVQISHLSSKPLVARELAFIKVTAESSKRPEILGVVDTFRASVIDISSDSLIIQVVGELGKIEAMIELLQLYGILELSRTGTTAMLRGDEYNSN